MSIAAHYYALYDLARHGTDEALDRTINWALDLRAVTMRYTDIDPNGVVVGEHLALLAVRERREADLRQAAAWRRP